MGFHIEEVGLTVAGNIVKKFDGTTTTLRVNAEQARAIADSVATVLELFKESETAPDPAPAAAKIEFNRSPPQKVAE